MKLELITLTGPKFEEDAYEVILPTAQGTIAVLPGHMPLVTLAVPGVISVRRHKGDPDDALEHFAATGGIVEISATKVRLLADEADHGREIIAEEASTALARAKAAKQTAKDQLELDQAQSLIDRSTVRLKVAELHRRRKTHM